MSSTPEHGAAHSACSTTPRPGVEAVASLTSRQREVLALIGQGLSTAEIARRLYRTVKTIESHRLVLGKRLGARNRVELARIAIQAGLAELSASGDDAAVPAGDASQDADGALRVLLRVEESSGGAEGFFRGVVSGLQGLAGAAGAFIMRHGTGSAGGCVAAWIEGEERACFGYDTEEAEDSGMSPGEVRTIPGGAGRMLAGAGGSWTDMAGGTILAALHGSSGQRLGTLVVVLRDADAPPMRILGAALRVLAGRVSAELERREAEERLASLRDLLTCVAGGVGVWERDLHDGRVTWAVNMAAPTSREDLLAMVHPEDRASVAGACERAASSEAVASVECRVRGRDGHERRMLMCCEFSPDSAGRPGWILGAMREIGPE